MSAASHFPDLLQYPPMAAPAKGEPLVQKNERLSLLHVEDCESDAALVARVLRKAGLQFESKRVETAGDMRAALSEHPWDVIIADYHMPEFDGQSALQTLLESGCDIPFIVVSGAVGEDVAVEMMKRGAHDFVMKGNLGRLPPAVEREIREARTRERRRRAEAALRNSEREFRQLAESIPQLIWITDENGFTIYSNTRYQQELGVAPTQPTSTAWAQRIHPLDREPCLTAWNESLRSGNEFRCEARFRLSNNGYRWFLMRAIPINDEQKSGTRWFGTCTDVNDQKRIQEQLTQTNSDLARSNAMLEQFAYISSHDLQEPLRNIAVYVQLLGMQYKGRLDATADEYIQFAHNGVVRMKQLVSDLLLFSRAGRHDRPAVPIDLEPILDEVLRNLRIRIQETGAQINRSPLPEVMGDAREFVQLFQNLVGNALKYRKEGVSPVIDISAQRQQDAWIFSVRDNGIGIDPRYFEQIFRIFTRLHTQQKYEGTGIGLAICERIVEHYRGRIWVKSTEGTGTTFYFTIPDALAKKPLTSAAYI